MLTSSSSSAKRSALAVLSITAPFFVAHTTHCLADMGLLNVHAGHTHFSSVELIVTVTDGSGFAFAWLAACACAFSASRWRRAASWSGLNDCGLARREKSGRVHFAFEDGGVLAVRRIRQANARAVPQIGDDAVAEQKQNHQEGVVEVPRLAELAVVAVVADALAEAVADAVVGAVRRRRAGAVAGGVHPAVHADALAVLFTADAVVVAGGVHVAERFAGRSVVVGIALADTVHAGAVDAGTLGAFLHGARLLVLYAFFACTLERLFVASSMTRTLQYRITRFFKSRTGVLTSRAVMPLIARTTCGSAIGV